MADGGLGAYAASLLGTGASGWQQQMQQQARRQMQPRVGAYTNQNSLGGGFFGDQGLSDAQQAFQNGDPTAMDEWARRTGASLSYPYGNPGQQEFASPEVGLPPGVHIAGSDGPWGVKAGDLVMNDGSGSGLTAWKPYTGETPGWSKTGGANGQGGPVGGGAGGAGGAGGGAVGGFGGSLGAAVGGAYGDIISRGGSLYTPLERASVINREGSTIARGTDDAIQAAREDAVRRGDTTGASLGTVEGRIRAQGAANQANAQTDREMGFKQEEGNRLLGALGGATGLISAQAANALAGQQFGLQALNTIANMQKAGTLPPAYGAPGR